MKTRDRIVDTAIALFNEQGTEAVSTNHIAQAMGISPGNLYYHFRNKEEIIRVVLDRMIAAWAVVYSLPDDRPPIVEDLGHMLRGNFEVAWEYRFFYRELVSLMQRDPQLRATYQAVRENGFTNIYRLFGYFVSAQVLRPPTPPTTLEDIAELCWMVGDFWLTSVELGGAPVTPEQMQRGVHVMLQILQPYLIRDA